MAKVITINYDYAIVLLYPMYKKLEESKNVHDARDRNTAFAAQVDLVCKLFGVKPEQVMDDLGDFWHKANDDGDSKGSWTLV